MERYTKGQRVIIVKKIITKLNLSLIGTLHIIINK